LEEHCGETRQVHPRICVLGPFHLNLKCDALYWPVRPSTVVHFPDDLPLKMIQAAFDWARSAYERVLAPEFYTFRKAVVDPPPLEFDPIGQKWEDSDLRPNIPGLRNRKCSQTVIRHTKKTGFPGVLVQFKCSTHLKLNHRDPECSRLRFAPQKPRCELIRIWCSSWYCQAVTK